MTEQAMAGVEARTQELGRLLHARFLQYAPSPVERLQDRLMLLLMEDPSLRTRLLRFVDVLAALPTDRAGRQTASLYREYFRAEFPALPRGWRLALAASASPLVPSPLLAWSARAATRIIASRFIVPPGAKRVERVLHLLEREGRSPSFDLLGEAVLSEEEAVQYRQRYLNLLERLGRHPLAGTRSHGASPALEVSLKLSSLTSQFNPADPQGTLRRVRPALEEICQAARTRGIGVTMDAEQYAYRDLAWLILQELLAPRSPLGDWADAGMVVQAYLKDAERHAQEVVAFAQRRGVPLRVRLVKGAYWDYEAIVAQQAGWPIPVHQAKGDTDVTFEQSARQLLEASSVVRLAVGSHNIRAHAYVEAVREALDLPPGTVEHQTLYRTLEGLSRALAQLGWPTRDYVPVGELIPGMAYLVRRLLENTSQVGFLTHARLHQELVQLLSQPRHELEMAPVVPSPDAPGFVNTPQACLFDLEERHGFHEALTKTRGQWGSEYPLRLGEERVSNLQVHPSVSPSYPDASLPVGWVHRAGVEEAKRAIAAANDAARAWAGRSLEERTALGLRAAELLRARKDKAAAWVVHEGGRTWAEALADVEEAIDHTVWNALQLRRLAPLIEPHYRPRGVVACIPPWNFPTALPAGMTSAALLAGNAVLLKSSAQTPISAQLLVEAFHEAGVPKEALIHLPGPGSTVGAMLVESPDVDMVAFTGSKEVGLWIYRTASQVAPSKGGAKRVIAEMGGKNAIIVFPDADMDEAVLGILRSAFSHAGQKCSACSRVLVHRDVYDQLRRRLVAAARSLPLGPADEPGTFIGPVIDSQARERILSFRRVAYDEGNVLLDLLDQGKSSPSLGPLIVEVDPTSAPTARVAQEEIFGPVLTLIPFGSEAEAVALVNNTVYALATGIFSRSPGVIARMVRACQAGNIYVNREIVGARVGIEPFGGFQLSGTGPKAGGEEYPLAFLARRTGYRQQPPEEEVTSHQVRAGVTLAGIRDWAEAPASLRLRRLAAAAQGLGRVRAPLQQAIAQWKGLPSSEANALAARTLEAVFSTLAAAPEVTTLQPTVKVPGQTNFVTWDTPRGIGMVAVDEGSDPQTLAALLFASLLAGNGSVVAVPSGPTPLAQLLVDLLRRAGAPQQVVALAPAGVSPAALATGPIHFAAVDLALEDTRALYRVLGVTEEDRGQRWVKALISMGEGPHPGEPGFLRLFAHPKAVSVRTLRHGADLQLI